MKNQSCSNRSISLHMPAQHFPILNKWLILLFLVIIAAGCKKITEEAGLSSICPVVISTDPADAEQSVVLNKKIEVTFNKVMDPSTINALTFKISNGAIAVTGLVSYEGTTASFLPTNNLSPNTAYTGTITTGAKDPAGNALVNNYVWTFTTGTPDLTPPTVTSTDPVSNAINVAFDKNISATFSEKMDSLSTTTNFTIVNTTAGGTAITGAVSYSDSTVVFNPSVNLDSNTTYTATINTGAKDIAGNTIVNNYTWSFTTMPPIILPVLTSSLTFGAFGGNAGITNQGLNTVINNGSIGTTAASTLVTGFHDAMTNDVYTETPLNKGNVTGGIFTAPPTPGNSGSSVIATNALLDATNAYNSTSPAAKPGGTDPGAGELGGLTLPPGIYKSASGTFKITNGDLTLDAMGNPNAVWIFQTAAGLTVGVAGPTGARSVQMINGALPKNVFWHVGSAAVINAAGGGVMVGNIISSAGITFSTADNAVQTVLNGRAISLVASVTMVNTTINVPQ